MLFNSLSYAVFLPIVFILYWAIPAKFRWILLLVSSYYFYMSWNPKYVVLILFTTVISFLSGILLEKATKPVLKNLIVLIAICACLSTLFMFKYFNFALSLLTRIYPIGIRPLNYLLPVGISFYTFQSISYTIDVYRGTCKAEKNLGIYAIFVSFFPQLVAGPIERSNNLLHQIRDKHSFCAAETYYGMRLIIWGLFKKILIADNLAIYVDKIYGNIHNYNGCSILFATVFFTLQIYCDFSGYTDIARGSAKLFGIDLMENFRSPYFSTSVKDFWSRWHISLSTWFKDYLYIPLGGNRVSRIRTYINLLITFFVSGLWHGANVTFIAWGAIHGAAQILENALGIKTGSLNRFCSFMKRILVFCFVSWAWIFFRAASISDALYATKSILSGITHPVDYFLQGVTSLDYATELRWALGISVLLLAVVDYASIRRDVFQWIADRNVFLRHAVAVLIILFILFFGYFGQSRFVYFQF